MVTFRNLLLFNVFRSLLRTWSRSPSVARCSSILPMAYITVVGCLPPKWRPISGRDASVVCLARYIAICRGTVTVRLVLFCVSSPSKRQNRSATACWIPSIVALRTCGSRAFIRADDTWILERAPRTRRRRKSRPCIPTYRATSPRDMFEHEVSPH